MRSGCGLSVVLAVVCAVGACGASTAEVKSAKTAVYNDDRNVFAAAVEVTEEAYKIAERTDDTIVTVPKFYSPTGELESPGAEDMIRMADRSVRVNFVIKVQPVGTAGGYAVTVTPETLQILTGMPMPRKLAPDDPNLPAFVLGRVDALYVAIHERAKPYVTKP